MNGAYGEKTIIICCAGMGTRLGISSPKALLNIDGEPLIIRLLKQLDNYTDIRIVVGYQAEKIIDIVKKYRRDIMFVFNYEYASTGPAASFSKALIGASEYSVVIDGDILISEKDLNMVLHANKPLLTHTKVVSDEPIYISVEKGKAIGFCEKSNYEWLGIANLETAGLQRRTDFVYEMIKQALPMESIEIDAIGIDTQDDYERAIEWFQRRKQYE